MSSVAIAGQQMDEAKKWVFFFCGNLDTLSNYSAAENLPLISQIEKKQLYQTFFPMFSLNGKRKQKQNGIRLSTPLESNFK